MRRGRSGGRGRRLGLGRSLGERFALRKDCESPVSGHNDSNAF